ncbi:MAG: class I SAM-dependent methyltransferase [Candidatus Dormibacteraceae bacterium]
MARRLFVKSKELYPAIFSRHAAAYQRRLDEVMSRGEAQGRQRAIELASVQPGMKVIDIACGPGTITRRLAALVGPSGQVVGVDLAPGMIELARAAGLANARFEVMDMESLAFANESFDVAFCGHGLQFAPDLGQALRESRRVLRTSGRLAASVPVTGVRESVWALLESVIDVWLPPAPQPVDQSATRAAVADPGAFRRVALDAGFTSAGVEIIDEHVRWESADQLVSMFTSWWDCASRLDSIDDGRREAFTREATETLRARFPGTIETTGRNHVLLATA